MTDITVLLVSYNQRRFIERALQSIANQLTSMVVDIVVADDASSDGTREVIEEWAGQAHFPVTFLPSSSRLGAAGNYARAFAAVSGQYAAVLDGDDEWLTVDKLQKQGEVLRHDPAVSMVSCRVLLYDEPATSSRVIPLIGTDTFRLDLTDESLAEANWFATFSSCMYRMAHIRRLPVSVFQAKAYDWLVNIAITQYGTGVLLPQVMTLYRVHESGVWSRQSEGERDTALLGLLPTYRSALDPRVHTSLDWAGRIIEGRLKAHTDSALQAQAQAQPQPSLGLARIARLTTDIPPRVSVVMTGHDGYGKLHESIISVLNQSMREFELIFVDNGFHDGSLKLLSSIADERLRVYPLGVKVSQAAAVNLGVQQSHGAFIALINAGDIWVADKLALQLDAMSMDTRVGAVFTRSRDAAGNARTRVGRGSEVVSRTGWFRLFFETIDVPQFSSALVRREVFERIGLFDDRLSRLFALDRWVAVCKHFDIIQMDATLVLTQNLDDQASAPQIMEEYAVIAERFFDGCRLDLIRDEFGDLLRNPYPDSEDEVAADLAFLWWDSTGPLGSIRKGEAIRMLRALLGKPRGRLLLETRFAFSVDTFHLLSRQPLSPDEFPDWFSGKLFNPEPSISETSTRSLARTVLIRIRDAVSRRLTRRKTGT